MLRMSGLQSGLFCALVIIGLTGCVYSECPEPNADLSSCFLNDLPCWTNEFPSLFPGDPATLANHFYLYTRDMSTDGSNACNGATPTEILWNDPDSMDGFQLRKTVVIAHGFRSHYKDDYISGLCDAFLMESDVNIIMVDWEEAAEGWNYPQSRVDTRLVGRELGGLLELLHIHQGLDYADVHIVGHSLGAHLAGFAGEYLQGQVHRITGLDPASPSFKAYTDYPGCTLDKSDAQFVDVIHSDLLLYAFGLKEAIGHQDFYPNRGKTWQTGCLFKPLGCAHMRAIDFFIASLKRRGNPSKGCNYPTTCCDGSGQQYYPKMGIEADRNMQDGEYCLNTNCK